MKIAPKFYIFFNEEGTHYYAYLIDNTKHIKVMYDQVKFRANRDFPNQQITLTIIDEKEL